MNLLTDFVDRVIATGVYDEMDRIFLANEVRALVGEDDLDIAYSGDSLFDLVEQLTAIAEKNGRIESLNWTVEMFECKLYSYLTYSPSVTNQLFWKDYKVSPVQACDNFYERSRKNNYIKTREIAKNVAFTHDCAYGQLEITINLSKPEKDPKEIANAKHEKQSNFPKCQLCMENEGYVGRFTHPARSNHRIIRLPLGDEKWGLQYSPYAYYEEHCIFFNETHQPMVIDTSAFRKILQLVNQFPHYFVGSNADLPIVGGSILTHEHFQGGRAVLPMAKAKTREIFNLPHFPTLSAGILDWPMSAIRLSGQDLEELVACASFIHEAWKTYSDARVDVLAASADGTPHHTVTPIARKNADVFELDLVLRDNHTTAEFPDGVFHPHQDVHHVKKENIGLIEVMGLAILPPRLKEELRTIEEHLAGQNVCIEAKHEAWVAQLEEAFLHSTLDLPTFMKKAVGEKFERVLCDAGVFKTDEEGKEAFLRFIHFLQEQNV